MKTGPTADRDAIVAAAIAEINTPTWGASKQFLGVHEIAQSDSVPEVVYVDTSSKEHAVVYFKVVSEIFYFAVIMSYDPVPQILGMSDRPYHDVYLRSRSEELTGAQIAAMTTLATTIAWNKTNLDSGAFSGIFRKNSVVDIRLKNEPGNFESKLATLLDYLDVDRPGVARLVAEAGGYIQVYTSFHNGNTMLGGHHLSGELIQRLASHNLSIDFDISADGNKFQS